MYHMFLIMRGVLATDRVLLIHAECARVPAIEYYCDDRSEAAPTEYLDRRVSLEIP